jgi:hypothetical protein
MTAVIPAFREVANGYLRVQSQQKLEFETTLFYFRKQGRELKVEK